MLAIIADKEIYHMSSAKVSGRKFFHSRYMSWS